MVASDTECAATLKSDDVPWPHRDSIAVGLFAISIAAVLAIQRHQFTRPNLGLLVIVVVAMPWVVDLFGWHQRLLGDRLELPLQMLWSILVIGGVYWLSVSFQETYDYAPFFIILLVSEMTAVAGPIFGAAVWGTGVASLVILTDVNHFKGLLIWAFAFTIGWMGGVAYRTQVRVAFELAEAQSKLAEQAALEERQRLAREIHDLVAHSLAVTVLQLSGARLALTAGDTGEAMAALTDAEEAGRSAMTEIRRAVGLLGSGETDGVTAPTPSAGDLPRLVKTFRDTGLAVDFDLEGDLALVPMAAGLASYRLVQESLSNVVKHAPGAPVELRVAVTDRDIRINVVNPVVAGVGPGPSGGNGLRGMVERAELLGGVATAGNGDGTWKVEVCIPWPAEPAEPARPT